MGMIRTFSALDRERLGFIESDSVVLQAGQIRVKTLFAALKHGTELALWKGHAAERGTFDLSTRLHDKREAGVTYPFALGNMYVGTVTESLDLLYREGDTVLGYGALTNEQVTDGAHVWNIGSGSAAGTGWKDFLCFDPAVFALGAVRDGHVRLGDSIAIWGLGAIGLMVLQCARLAGASKIFAIDPSPTRRAIAVEIGADYAINPLEIDTAKVIKQVTVARGVDVCIDYSGAAKAMSDALRSVAYGGTVVAGSFANPYPIGLDFGGEAHMNRVNLVFSRACSEPNPDHPRWNENRLQSTVLSMIYKMLLSGQRIVWPIIAFEELPFRCEELLSDSERAIKLGVRFD